MASAVSSTLDGRLAGADLKAKGPARWMRAATLCPEPSLPSAVDNMAAGTVLFHPTKTNLAALGLMRHLGVYHTAWRLKHELMQVMQTREAIRRPVTWPSRLTTPAWVGT